MDLKMLRELLREWEVFGFEERRDGYILYGTLETGTTNAWLHSIFPPVPEDALRETLEEHSFLVEFPYATVLANCNGAHLFEGEISLFGLHRYGLPFRWATIPHNLINAQVEDRTIVDRFDGLIVGSCGSDGDILVQFRDGAVAIVERNSMTERKRWPSLDEFLQREFECLGKRQRAKK